MSLCTGEEESYEDELHVWEVGCRDRDEGGVCGAGGETGGTE